MLRYHTQKISFQLRIFRPEKPKALQINLMLISKRSLIGRYRFAVIAIDLPKREIKENNAHPYTIFV